mgnify:CR=1 FL=1
MFIALPRLRCTPRDQPPRPIVERVNRALNAALADDEIRKRFDSYGAENLVGSTPEAADAFGAAQRARWIPAVKAMGIKL